MSKSEPKYNIGDKVYDLSTVLPYDWDIQEVTVKELLERPYEDMPYEDMPHGYVVLTQISRVIRSEDDLYPTIEHAYSAAQKRLKAIKQSIEASYQKHQNPEAIKGNQHA